VKQDQVAPMRIGLKLFESGGNGPSSFFIAHEDSGQAAREFTGHLPQVKLGLPKLNFQVLRRTMATLAQKKGSVKDIQAHLRHAKADYHGRRVHAEPAGKRKADGRFCL